MSRRSALVGVALFHLAHAAAAGTGGPFVPGDVGAERHGATVVPTRMAQAAYQVEELQRALNELGYNAGPADGALGPTTRSAIRTYQADQRLPVTGEFSPGLLDHVRTSLAAATGTAPSDAMAPTTDVVAEIQAELRRRGYGVPVVSGQLDAPTEAAIRAYQRDRGIAVTGEPSGRLLDDLRAAGAQVAGVDRDQVREIQRELQRRGYDVGVPDGVLGPTTRNAIRTYQADAGLPATGEPSASLLRSLRLGAEEEDEAEDEEVTAGQPDLQPGWRWSVALDDDFTDRGHTRDTWTVHSGQFTFRDGALVSRVPLEAVPESVARQQEEGEAGRAGDFGQALLRGVLEGVIGAQQQRAAGAGARPGPEERPEAEISAAARLQNAFRIRLDLASHLDAGRFAFGPYHDADVRGAGYRLAYDSAGERPSLELLALSPEGGVRVVGRARAGAVDLEDGGTHRIVWTRAADGRMTVIADGSEVMSVTDLGLQRPFAGLTLTNAGGEFAIHGLTVEVPERRE